MQYTIAKTDVELRDSTSSVVVPPISIQQFLATTQLTLKHTVIESVSGAINHYVRIAGLEVYESGWMHGAEGEGEDFNYAMRDLLENLVGKNVGIRTCALTTDPNKMVQFKIPDDMFVERAAK